jgi:hypothetical protein
MQESQSSFSINSNLKEDRDVNHAEKYHDLDGVFSVNDLSTISASPLAENCCQRRIPFVATITAKDSPILSDIGDYEKLSISQRRNRPALKYPKINRKRDPSTLAEEAKESLIVAGIAEGLEHVLLEDSALQSHVAATSVVEESVARLQQQYLDGVFSEENAETLQHIALKIAVLFKTIKNYSKADCVFSTSDSDSASVSVRDVKRCIQKMGIVDGFSLTTTDVSIIFTQLKVKRLSIFGA